jgi:hypothetical protein
VLFRSIMAMTVIIFYKGEEGDVNEEEDDDATKRD